MNDQALTDSITMAAAAAAARPGDAHKLTIRLRESRRERREAHHGLRISPGLAEDDGLSGSARERRLREMVLRHLDVEHV